MDPTTTLTSANPRRSATGSDFSATLAQNLLNSGCNELFYGSINRLASDSIDQMWIGNSDELLIGGYDPERFATNGEAVRTLETRIAESQDQPLTEASEAENASTSSAPAPKSLWNLARATALACLAVVCFPAFGEKRKT